MKKSELKKQHGVFKFPPPEEAKGKKGAVAWKPRQPARAKDSGGKVLASCPEFTLYKDGWLESSPEVERALVLSLMRINNAPGAAERERMRLGLWNLMLLAAGRAPFNDWDDFRDKLLDDLAQTIGKTLLDALGEGENLPDEKARKAAGKPRRLDEAARKAGKILSRAVGDVETAAASLARFRADLPMPGDKSPGAWTWMLQHTAKEIFRETQQRPTKTAIRIALGDRSKGTRPADVEPDAKFGEVRVFHGIGEVWVFHGNDPAENWRRVFADAGLASLPD